MVAAVFLKHRSHLANLVLGLDPIPDLEEPELVLGVRHEQVLCLLVVVESQRTVLAPDARTLVATECGPSRVRVIVIHPDATSLQVTTGAIGNVAVAGPHTGTKTVEGVVGDRDAVVVVVEARHREDGSKDLFLEETHLVVALKDCGLHVETATEVATEVYTLPTEKQFCSLLLADVDVAQNLFELIVLGIVNLRGEIVSVIDVRKFFDLPQTGLPDLNKVIVLKSGDMVFGILADVILGVRRIALAEIQSSLPTLTGIRGKYLKGITPERTVVLDAGKLLADEDIVVQEQVDGQ